MRKLCLLLLCLCLAIAPSCASAGETITIVVASDMHYLSPSLTDYGPSFMELLAAADGKMTHRTPEIMYAFAEEMIALGPDAVVLTGDLTLNGAPASHYDLDDILRPVEEAGIDVLVLPGNHDAGDPAYAFSEEEGTKMIMSLGDNQFAGRYRQYGYTEAVSRDEFSSSYIALVGDHVRLLLIDSNCNDAEGWILPETFAWIEAQLADAQQAGALVICATHQNVFQHSPLFARGYVIGNGAYLAELLAKYGVPLNLSGHMHIQHIVQQDGVAEIATSSLAIAPHQYGVITITPDGAIHYETRVLDVSGWAQRHGLTDPELLDFASASRSFFDMKTRSSAESRTEGLDITPQERERMIALAVQVNGDYFAGCVSADYDKEACDLWMTHCGDTFYPAYLESMVSEAGVDMRTLTLPPRP